MANFYRYFELVLAANEVRQLSAYANFLTMLANSSATDVQISIDGASFESLPKGLSVELPQGDKFTYILFKNTTAAVTTIKVCLSSGRVLDSRATIVGTLGIKNVANTIFGTAAFDVLDSVYTAIAANTNRREIIIQNHGTGDIWVGSSGGTAGYKLAAGKSIILATTAAIYLRAASGTQQATYLELKDS